MSKPLRTTVLALVLGMPVLAMPALASPVEVAINRCNAQTIDDAQSHVRDYDRHSPGNSPSQLVARYGAILDVLSMLNEEREILSSICSNEAQPAAMFAQIAATSAWALALESDIAARLNRSCPAAAQALPTMMLSDAWLALANVVNENNGTVPAAFADVIPKVQSRAATAGLTLPGWPETSAYWRDGVHTKAKAAIAACPTSSPSPTPSGRFLRTIRK
jgi:hypothetical protein